MKKILFYLITTIMILIPINVQANSKITYQSHISNVGWQKTTIDGSISGTTGQRRQMEAIKIFNNNLNGNVVYKSYNSNQGWQKEVTNGLLSGSTGQSLGLEAISIWLTGNISTQYDVYYKVHVSNIGWMDWAKNGSYAGTIGYGNKIEAIIIKLVKKDEKFSGSTKRPYLEKYTVQYQSHVSNEGWQKKVIDGKTSGTVGKTRQIEAIKISLTNKNIIGNIKYSSYVKGIGWQKDVIDGAISGTTGQAKRIEAIKINLTGEYKNQYNIYYRTHIQNIGWLDWTKNGSPSGTVGYNLQMEAIEIKLVKKDELFSGSQKRSYLEKDNKITYSSHMSYAGWLKEVDLDNESGIFNRNRKLEAIKINFSNQTEARFIRYKSHVSNIGWMKWVNANNISGTTGQGRQMEAIQIELLGELKDKYDIYYRTYVSKKGWASWSKNGEVSGTTGQGLALEGYQIKLVKKEEAKDDDKKDEYVPEVDDKSNFSNLIIFAKFNDDNRDIFNATKDYGTYKTNNFESIKKMYNENILYTGYDASFKKYISTITEGKINVNNIFLQQSSDKNKIKTYVLKGKQSDYSSGDNIVSEIISEIKKGNINNNFGNVKYDNITSGILDNLTIIIQGSTSSNNESEDLLVNHKTDYGANDTINGKIVRSYIIHNSSSLVSNDASISASESQSGVISHEFLHVLGFPDLYRKTDDGVPVGPWDIMASVSYFKQYPLSYLRMEKGWIKENTITKSGNYTLDAVSETGDKKIYIIKTPLSDTEQIILEYRKKQDKIGQTEYSLPESGLLIYRVDKKVDNLTNVEGNNYIYVYRPNVTNGENSTDKTFLMNGNYMNNVYNAALNPDKGKNEYGSTNLSDDYTKNTIYYSDGTNSGIKIKNIKYLSNKNQINFDVELADYKNYDIWDSLGTISQNSSNDKSDIIMDENGKIYISFYDKNKTVYVKKYENNNIINVGNSIQNSEISSIVSYNNDLYVAVRNSQNYSVDLYKLNNNTWIKIKSYSIDYTQDINFIKGNNTLYLSYNSNNKLIVVDIINNKILIEKSFNYLANPKFAFYNNKIFVAYSDYFGSDKKSKLSSIDSNGIWKIELSLNMEQTNIHDIKVYNDNLYAIYGGNNIKPTLVKCHNSNCNIFNTVPIDSYLTLSLNVNDNIYVSYIKNTVDDKKTYVLKSDGISYSLYNDNLGTGILNFKIINDDNNLYSLINISDSLYLKKKIMKNN